MAVVVCDGCPGYPTVRGVAPNDAGSAVCGAVWPVESTVMALSPAGTQVSRSVERRTARRTMGSSWMQAGSRGRRRVGRQATATVPTTRHGRTEEMHPSDLTTYILAKAETRRSRPDSRSMNQGTLLSLVHKSMTDLFLVLLSDMYQISPHVLPSFNTLIPLTWIPTMTFFPLNPFQINYSASRGTPNLRTVVYLWSPATETTS
ncbi:hypothetical protein LXA43DRAFT_170425 [Ganoderma leucocontextum]|nr:hypothetical protein LXA43DRAFT_170425 [Ganoderma leucocontextum]